MSNNHLLITGGTGFVGQKLCPMLIEQGYRLTVLTRNPKKAKQILGDNVQTISEISAIPSLEPIEYVINLAGEGILDKRWTPKRKQALLDSRVALTESLVATLVESEHQPKAFVSGSAVGFYGDCEDDVCSENRPPGKDFAAMLCKQWETAANRIKAIGSRLSIVRIGVVLDNEGGALQRMLPPFKMGLGGKIGSGEQWFPWIHRHDLCKLIIFLLSDSRASGIYNATAPTPVTNKEFTQALGKTLGKPTMIPVPSLALKLALGEAAILLLGGQNAPPNKLLNEGFKYQYTTIDRCLKNCL